MEFGFKDLYDVSLKATYPMEVAGQKIEQGEPIAFFDKISISNFQENQEIKSANGGYDNRAYIWWTTTKELHLNFTQGVFSKKQYAIMVNSNLIVPQAETNLLLTSNEAVELDENSCAELKNEVAGQIFIYNEKTGEKITGFQNNGKEVIIPNSPFLKVVVNYQYIYQNRYTFMQIGNQLTNGYLSLEGKTRVKDDTTGHIITGIIKIPKLKLMSKLSLTLGQEAAPIIGQFSGVAVPDGDRNHSKVMEFFFLSDDIDADIV